MTKIFCTEESWKTINCLFELSGISYYTRNDLIAQILGDSPALRITEGPNEIINYRCGLDILFSLNDGLKGNNTIASSVHKNLIPLSSDFDQLLKKYSRFIYNTKSKYPSLIGKQLVLNRVVSASIETYKSFCSLMTISSQLNQNIAISLIKNTENTIRESEMNLNRIIFDEENNFDHLLDTHLINDKMKMEYL
ncbi:MAG: acyl-CoA/acyl-ACP dehydrogenase [Ignavibacteria bacterium]|nr:acyl-CoA/acyl-ACP dehydrogenase [Ignavibacteria bacterium]